MKPFDGTYTLKGHTTNAFSLYKAYLNCEGLKLSDGRLSLVAKYENGSFLRYIFIVDA